MIKDTPNYWGKPLTEWKHQNLDPLTQEMGKTLVARSCSVPHCTQTATWDNFCDQHLVEIKEAYEQWEEWKVVNSLDSYFLPYEQLHE